MKKSQRPLPLLADTPHLPKVSKLTKIGFFVVGVGVTALSWQVQAELQPSSKSLSGTSTASSLIASSDDLQTDYDFEQLTQPFGANIDFASPNTPTAQAPSMQLIKFSSLSPAILALISDNTTTPTTQNLRIVDSQGRIMPIHLRQPQKLTSSEHPVAVVSVATDNPMAMAKLRQVLQMEVEQAEQDNPQASIQIKLNQLPSNQHSLDPNNQIHTWWLANPLKVEHPTTDPNIKLQLQFGDTNPQHPLQVQLYGSDDLQSWQILDQSVISPFEQKSANAYNLTLNADQAHYRYWQVITNQPVKLSQATVKRDNVENGYFLTRATFQQDKSQPTHWRLALPQPALVTGVNFFVPENQLWQVTLNKPNQQSNATASTDQPVTLANAQVTATQTELKWQNQLVQQLELTGQMSQSELPVNLLTPVYELYFLAQGTAPYHLLINDRKANAQPNISLSNEQIVQFTQSAKVQEGQLQTLTLLTDPNSRFEQYKKWALWGVLLLIVLALASLAYRLYQQITIKNTP
ncbi:MULTISPECIES: DUF3999 family protein [unclassified Moraxella]|uniref:DUF3999 family protein n=1 Tax=unclassified Moraxella TaxID=2685852 RepID=UPI003AF70727